MDAGHLLAAMGSGILKRITDDPGAGFSGDDLGCVNRIIINFLLYSYIEILGILPEDHHVHIVKWCFYCGT